MRRLLLCLPLLFASAVLADSDIDRVKAALSRALPDTKVDRITASPIPGLYEIAVGTRVAYVSSDGKYILIGDLIESGTQTNLTSAVRQKLQRQAIDAIGEENMIVIGPKQAKHEITVFTDVDCAYCAKLHREVPKLVKQGVRVRYLFYPQAGPDSSSFKRAISVWCAKDRVKAIGVAKAGGKIEARNCDNPVMAHYELALQLGIDRVGTPTIILDDGRLVQGYRPAEVLVALLEDKQKTAAN